MTLATLDPNPLVAEAGGIAAGLDGSKLRTAIRSRAARYLVPALVVLFLANVALTQRGDLEKALTALRGARWVWLPGVMAASAGTYGMAALVLNSASRDRLSYRRTLAVQVAAAFTNRLAPGGIGGMATNLRYLERCGFRRSEAVSTVSITWAAGIVAHVAVVLGAGSLFWLSGNHTFSPDLPSGAYWAAAGGLVTLLVAAGALARRLLGRRLASLAAALRASLTELRNRPGDLMRLLAGSAGMTGCHTVALVVSVQSFGGGVSLLDIAVVYLAATAFAAAIPIPGGVGPLETALTAGLVGLGAAGGAAIAAVLTYRLATLWMPIVPGALTFRALRTRRIL